MSFGRSSGSLWAVFMRIFLVVRFIGHYFKSTFFLCAFLTFYHSCVQVHIVPLECNQDAPLLRFNRGFRKPRSHKAVAYLLPASPPRFLELYVLVFRVHAPNGDYCLQKYVFSKTNPKVFTSRQTSALLPPPKTAPIHPLHAPHQHLAACR